VIAVDTNILVYAHRRDSEFYRAAARALRGVADEGQTWGIPWPCLGEFFAIATNPRIYEPSSTVTEAVEQIDIWLESPTVVLLGETVGTWPLLRNLLVTANVVGPMAYDARIAVLCVAHGVRELWTADRDYGRFPGLRTRNPLVA
jgi:toxin-antitoxin system PIN domain toxin